MTIPDGPLANVVTLTQALVRCRSVTPDDDGALDVVAQALSPLGFRIERPTFSAPGTPDTPNLFARLGHEGPCLVFAGHTDVVPPGDEAAWRHSPFGGVVEDGWLHGRGTADMKGGIAAMLAAVQGFVATRGREFGGSIAFLVTGDEEGPAINGTTKLLDWAAARGERFDFCVLGEPTNPAVLGEMAKIGRRGSLTGRLVVRGIQGHVAYPHLVRNPIPVFARIVSALSDVPLDAGSEAFDASTLQWTSVDVGNPATNVVPGEVRAVFNIRFNDRWTPDTLAAAIQARIAQVTDADAWELAFDPTNSVSFLTERSPLVDLVADSIEAVCGMRPELSTTGGTSDARFIKDHCPVIEFGLVGATMHAVDERVAVADLVALTAVYRGVLDRFFARKP